MAIIVFTRTRWVALVGDGRAVCAAGADHLAKDGNRLDALLGDDDLATSEQQ